MNTYVFPVPQNVLEAFSDTLLGDQMPLWQLLLFVAVMPGILEELAFRGVLLHGLRKLFGSVGVCLMVGAIFGIFHVSLFRLLPTAYLGVVFAAVVLLTGSIFPVMVSTAIRGFSAWAGADSTPTINKSRLKMARRRGMRATLPTARPPGRRGQRPALEWP